MSISNIQLREKMFGSQAATGTDTRVHQELPAYSPAAYEPVQRTPSKSAARAGVAATPGDIAIGLTALLVIFTLLVPAGAPGADLFGVLAGLRAFAASFALPAFLVLAGYRLRDELEKPWFEFIEITIAPLAVAFGCWFAIMMAAGLASGTMGDALNAVAAQMYSVSLLFLLPVFFIGVKLLRRMRPATMLLFAAIIEILHTNTGHFLLVDAMRGAVFFLCGVYFAHNMRSFRQFADNRPGAAFAGIVLWLAFAAFIAFSDHYLAHGQDISTLPFTSLGLGAAGAMAMIVIAQLIYRARGGKLFALAGRHWLAVYTGLPLVVLTLAGLLHQSGWFGSASEAVLTVTLGVVAVTAILAFLTPGGSESADARTASGFYRNAWD